MTTSQQTSILYEIEKKLPIPAGKRAYFAARLRNRLYNFIMTKFKENEHDNGLTKAELARRIGRDPAVVTRLLASPGNWRSDTASDLLLGICGEELEFFSSSPLTHPKQNDAGFDWLAVNARLIGAPSGQGQTQGQSHDILPARVGSSALEALAGGTATRQESLVPVLS